MKIAKDGKPYDINNLPDTEPNENEVEVVQFLRPEGKRRRMIANVGKETALLAKDMILSAEELGTGKIALYARYQNEDEEKERLGIAENKPGQEDPTEMLKIVIIKKYKERQMLSKFKRKSGKHG